MKRILIVILCTTLFATSCGTSEPVFIIYPDECEINIGEEFPISLQGSNIPENGMITWTATKGTINPTTGYSVIYTAPQEPGTVSINAILEVNGEQSSAKGLTCEILAPETEVPPATQAPAPVTEPPTLPVGDTIAITEVMAYPCNFTDSLPSINEYIELYNYGGSDVNVGGWWFGTTGGGQGTPDQLKSWNSVNPTINLGSNYTVNSTVIHPGSFAVVVSPKYHTGSGSNQMPYHFSSGTVVLTFSTSQYMGNDSLGLSASTHPLTTIVLYKGTDSIMSTVVSTYGTPYYGSVPDNIKDDHLDNLPFIITEQCHAMERIDASGPDSLDNWREIDGGKPGLGNYPAK